MDIASRKLVCEAVEQSERNWQKGLAEMGQACLKLFLILQPHLGSARCLPLKSCAKFGFKIIGGRMVKSAGEAMRRFLRRHAISVLPTITRHATAKSGVRPGWDTKCI